MTCREPTIDEPIAGATAPGAPSTSCSSLAIDVPGASVVAESTAATPLPPAAPGLVPDGVYALSGYEWHVPGAHEANRRTVLRIQGGNIEMVFSRNSDAPAALSGTVHFAPDGTMGIAVVCPRAGSLEFDHYAVVPNGLILISATQGKMAVFTHLP